MPDHARAALAAAQDVLRANLRAASFPPPENMHCTLAFLGEVADDGMRALSEAHGATATVPVVRSGLGELGAFPSSKRARVVWVGLTGDIAPVAATLHEALREHGFAVEDRPFRPHVTIARLRSPARVALDVVVDPVAFDVDRVMLFRSTLRGSKHPVYEPISEVRLRD